MMKKKSLGRFWCSVIAIGSFLGWLLLLTIYASMYLHSHAVRTKHSSHEKQPVEYDTFPSPRANQSNENKQESAMTGKLVERLPPIIVNSGSPHEEEVEQKKSVKRDLTEKNKDMKNATQEISKEKEQLCNGHQLPSGGLCLTKNYDFVNDNMIWDGKLCRGLEDLFGYSSVLELRAGLGHYGRCFYRIRDNVIDTQELDEKKDLWRNYWLEMGIAGLRNKKQVIKSWTGYDGATNVRLLSRNFVNELDLTLPINLGRKYDWVMSSGIGNAISQEKETVFMNNLIEHACKGIVFAWSPIAFDSHIHLDPTQNDYIKNLLKERGLVHDKESEAVLRKTVRLQNLKNSIMVFKIPKDRQC